MIRPALNSDFEAIYRVSDVLGYGHRDYQKLALQFGNLLQSASDRIWVAQNESIVCGWIHAGLCQRVASNTFIEIYGLAVAEHHQRLGIGTQLIGEVESWASGAGCPIRVRTNALRETTKDFYESAGFKITKTQLVLDKEQPHPVPAQISHIEQGRE